MSAVPRQRDILRELSQQRQPLIVAGAPIVPGSQLVKESIEADRIVAHSLTANEIKAGEITTETLAAGSVTTEILAAEAVVAGKIKAGEIVGVHIAANTITGGKLVVGTISATELGVDSVTSEKILAGAIVAGKIAAEQIETGHLQAFSVTSGKLAAESVIAGKISAGAVEAGHLASGAVTTGSIASGAVTAGKITVSELSALSGNLGTITAGTITGATVQTAVSGSRVVINGEGWRAYDAIEPVFEFDIATGDLTLKGEVLAGSVVPAGTVSGQLIREQLPGFDQHEAFTEFFERRGAMALYNPPSSAAGETTVANLGSLGGVATLGGSNPALVADGLVEGAAALSLSGVDEHLGTGLETRTNLAFNPLAVASGGNWAADFGGGEFKTGEAGKGLPGTIDTAFRAPRAGEHGTNDFYQPAFALPDASPAKAGESYTLSAYGRAEALGGEVRAFIQFFDAEGTFIFGIDSPVIPETLEYQRVSVTAVAPANTVAVRGGLALDNNPSLLGKYSYASALLIERAAAAEPYCPTPNQLEPWSPSNPEGGLAAFIGAAHDSAAQIGPLAAMGKRTFGGWLKRDRLNKNEALLFASGPDGSWFRLMLYEVDNGVYFQCWDAPAESFHQVGMPPITDTDPHSWTLTYDPVDEEIAFGLDGYPGAPQSLGFTFPPGIGASIASLSLGFNFGAPTEPCFDGSLFPFTILPYLLSAEEVEIANSLSTLVLPAANLVGKLTDAQIEAIAAAKLTGQITETQIGTGAISTPKIQAGAIEAAQIAAGAIVTGKVAAGTITATELATDSVTAGKIKAGAIESGHIASETIVAGDIAAGTLTATQIAAETITGAKIAAGAIVASKLNVEELSAITANLGEITAGTITSATVRSASSFPNAVFSSAGLALPEYDTLKKSVSTIEWKDSAGVTKESIRAIHVEGLRSMEAQVTGASTSTYLTLVAADSEPGLAKAFVNVGSFGALLMDGEGGSGFLQIAGGTGKRKVNRGQTGEVAAITEAEVEHGLGETPVAVHLTPLGATSWHLVSMSSTKFKFRNDGATKCKFQWTAET